MAIQYLNTAFDSIATPPTTHICLTPNQTNSPKQVIGQYGLRNAVQARTYIEDDATNVAWTWLQAGVDAGLVMAILRKHPYSLLPVLTLNAVGHSSYPGTGLKALDGLDIFGLG